MNHLSTYTNPVTIIGYDKSAALAKQACAEGKIVRQLAYEEVVGVGGADA